MTKKKGTKFDQGKSRLELVDPDWLLDVGHVLAHGASLHGDNNWKKISQARYIAASMRHILAIQKGEYLDPETQKPHAAHVACDSMFLHYLGGQNEVADIRPDADNTATHDPESQRANIISLLDNDETTAL